MDCGGLSFSHTVMTHVSVVGCCSTKNVAKTSKTGLVPWCQRKTCHCVKVPGVINGMPNQFRFTHPQHISRIVEELHVFDVGVRKAKVSFTSESSGNQNIWTLRL